MHRLVPPHIQRAASMGAMHKTVKGAALLIDAEGSTALSARLQPYGTRGAEAFADILSEIFTPMVNRVVSSAGSVVEFGGDGILAVFSGEPDLAVSRAVYAALGVMEDLSKLSSFATPDGPASLTVRASIGAGSLAWRIWSIDNQDVAQNAAHVSLGTAIDEARTGERVTPGGVVTIGPTALASVPPGLKTSTLSDGFEKIISWNVPHSGPEVEAATSDAPKGTLRFYPDILLEADPRAEFRDVVAVFMEFDAQPDSSLEQLLTVLARHRGYLNQVIKTTDAAAGLRAFALWGAPTSHEHDVEYALRFLEDLRTHSSQLGLRAGVTRSTAFTGFIGGSLQAVYTAIGPGINLAARMCSVAGNGEIWVDRSIRSRLAEPWEFAETGERGYKGFPETLSTFRVEVIPPVGVASTEAGEFVGRGRELDHLEDLLAPLWAGRNPGVIAVVGEPGIGKSRLLRAVKDRLAERTPPPVWIELQADEIRTQPLATLRDAIARYLGGQGEGDMGTRLESYLERLTDDSPDQIDQAARAHMALGDLLQLAPEVEVAEQLDPKTRFENLVQAVRYLVQAIERTAPVIASVFDGQWIDSGTAEVVRRVSEELAGSRVAVLVETRTLEGGIGHDHYIDVGPMGPDDIAEVARITLGESPSPSLVPALTERSGGNPFFAQQLLEHLRRDGLLDNAEEALTSSEAGLEVPLDMRQVLVARLDDLSGPVRRLVQTASVLGREVDLDVLRQMADEPNNYQARIRAAQDAGIWDRVDGDRVAFSSLLVRDAAYGMLLHADARSLHADAATAIAATSNSTENRSAELAYHHDRAGNSTIAASLYIDAGRAAAARFDNDEALGHLGRGLELLELKDDLRRHEALKLQHDIYELEGDRTLQEKSIESMERLADHNAAIQRDVTLLRGRLLAGLGRYDEAEEAVEGASTSSASPSERGSLLFFKAQLSRNRGMIDDARDRANTARNLFEQSGDGLNVAKVNDFMGGIAWETGDFETAAALHRSAADVFGEAGKVIDEIKALNNLGTALFALGDYLDARTIHQAGADRSRGIGYRMGEGDHLDNIGGTAWAMWELDLAMQFYTEALKIREGMDDEWGMAISKGNLGATQRAMGNPDVGLELYREGLQIDRRIGRRRGEAYNLHGIGLCHLDLGRYNLATESLGSAAKIREELVEVHLANESHVASAVAMLRRGDAIAARELVERVLADEGADFFSGAVESTAARIRAIEVLEATSSEKAESLRQRTKEHVIRRAERIVDPEQRRAFLQEFEKRSGGVLNF